MMSKNRKQNSSRQAKLMQRIQDVRYTDMEEEKRLCKVLLDVSEAEQYFYGCAFANVYLLDSHLALGEYGSCDFYLMRANRLCREFGFDDLLLVLCNCAGLYYQKLDDDQSALAYFLEGEHLAEKFGNRIAAGKLFNNIGYSFARNQDYENAKKYFELACQTIEADETGDAPHRAATYLTNLAEICDHMGDTEGCLTALQYCAELNMDDTYSRMRQECAWCSYYSLEGKKEQCTEIVDRILASHLLEVEDQFFICDMAEGLCGNMLDIKDFARAKQLLDILLNYEYDTSLSLRSRILILEIRCWEAFGETEKLKQAYREHYALSRELARIENETSAQSLMSKINIYQATIERAAMQEQMQALEDASQMDELTGLYNRRYFNKLVTKVAFREDIHTLGFLMLDVDFFKQYNDFYGHFKGDGALRTVAHVLSSCAQEDIFVSRYGGDEFVCLCVNLSNDAVEGYAKAVIEALKGEQVPHEKNPISGLLSVSIGCSNEAFHLGMDTDELLNLADSALYAVKENERGGYCRKSSE